MKKILPILSLVLILTIFLTGCGLPGLEEEKESREPLNLAEWPTPVPGVPTPTPTPFPKTTVVPKPTSAAVSDSAPDTAASPAVPASIEELGLDGLNLSGNTAELAEQISLITGGLEPIGAAMVLAADTTIHQGPADTEPVLGTLDQKELTAVLGKNAEGDWIYVITPSLVQGWLPFGSVRLIGNLAKAPELSPDQLNASSGQGGAASVLSGLSSGVPTSILSELPPAGTALVIVESTPIRSGPSTAYGALDTLQQGDVAGILGKNADGSWLYIATLAPAIGWVPIDTLRTLGDLEGLRVLPADPIAAIIGRATGSTASGGAISRQTIDVSDLEPVTSAQVSNALLNLRQRPGATYVLLDSLSQGDEVTILALNRDKEWALVKTTGGQLGWGSMDYLTTDGSLADAPQLVTLTPDKNHPADQVAPVATLSSSTTNVAITNNTGSTGNAATTSAASTGTIVTTDNDLALSANTLAPVGSGTVVEKIDMRRGPGTNYGQLHTLTLDEPITVWGVNEHRDWAVVESTNSRVGWVPVNTIKVPESALANAPQVLTAWVKSNEIEVLNGPGIFYDTVGVVAINDLVSVLGLNEGRNWVLIETLGGGRGWIPIRFLEISGSLNDIPELPAQPVAQTGSPGQAVPVPSGPPTGQLVFQTASGNDIMLINADGTGLHSLTQGIDPVLSYDGQQVAFTRWQGDSGSLWTINTDGTNERVILNEIRKAKGPDWSPDSSQIILNFQHGGHLKNKRQCRNIENSPNIPRNATDFKVGINSDFKPELCWTIPPDEQWSLRLVNVADGTSKDIYGGLYAFRPTFDPARPWRVVSDSGNGLLAVDINRDDYREPLTDNRADGSPVMSPDGSFIVVSTGVQGGHDIFRMNADGTGRVRLTQTPLWVPVQPDSNSSQWNNVAPAWSPDGTRIAFLTDRTGPWQIWLMNADGSDQRPMFSEDINDQLDITYNYVDERVLSWR